MGSLKHLLMVAVFLFESSMNTVTSQSCSPSCEWSPWKAWSDCTQTCGSGTRQRTRPLCCPSHFNDFDACLSHCNLPRDTQQIESCNAFCYNGASINIGRCQCSSAYYGACCQSELECATPVSPTNGVVKGSDFRYGQQITYECNSGYNMTSGNSERTCSRRYSWLSSGYWTGTKPTCTYVETCSSNPCQHGATCVDGLNEYTCACPPYYTGTHCQYDIMPPQMASCPNDTVIRTTEKSVLAEWQIPMFWDERGSVVDVTSNYVINSTTLPWGEWVVQYAATKHTNGLQTACQFTISVYPFACQSISPPKNGALACNGWNSEYGEICALFCEDTRDVPPDLTITNLYICGASGNRVPQYPSYDCSANMLSSDLISKSEAEFRHYYPSSCNDTTPWPDIANAYIVALKNSQFAAMCTANKWSSLCTPQNVDIRCG